MSKPLLFFSDVHLGAPNLHDDRQRQQSVLQFLDYAAENRAAVYIVGDLFEFWFEYKQVIPKANFPVLAALYKMTSQGLEVHYLPGNHDLWIGSFLQDDIGLIVHGRATRIQAGAYNVFAIHGDGAAASDKGYRFLRKIMSNGINIRLYRFVHPDFGIPFAKRMSQVSRQAGAAKSSWEREYVAFAKQKFSEGYDVVIMGHTHRPFHKMIDKKQFINLGDWLSHFSYCEITGDEVALRQWPTKQVYIEPEWDRS